MVCDCVARLLDQVAENLAYSPPFDRAAAAHSAARPASVDARRSRVELLRRLKGRRPS
jgi:hypothetical protein